MYIYSLCVCTSSEVVACVTTLEEVVAAANKAVEKSGQGELCAEGALCVGWTTEDAVLNNIHMHNMITPPPY